MFTTDCTISPCTLANWPTGISMVASTAPFLSPLLRGSVQVRVRFRSSVSIRSPDLISNLQISDPRSQDLRSNLGISGSNLVGCRGRNTKWTCFGPLLGPIPDPFWTPFIHLVSLGVHMCIPPYPLIRGMLDQMVPLEWYHSAQDLTSSSRGCVRFVVLL